MKNLLALFLVFSTFAAFSHKPNIIFIFSDDHTTQAISAYGSKIAKTPNIDRIANLARLDLPPEEGQRMLDQINGFFTIVDAMRAVDTTGVEPLPHPIATIQEMALRLRDDVASEPNQREANQQSAPAVERGLFLVPKVIE